MEVMLDIETLDTRPSAVVLSIGAVAFDWGGAIGEPFSVRLDTTQQSVHGRTTDVSTVEWWLQQSDIARAAIAAPPTAVMYALDSFALWLTPLRPVGVWGCGSDFDCTIVASLYASFDYPCPFTWRQHRCYRTLKALRCDVKAESHANHVAVDDAIRQAVHAIRIGQALGLAPKKEVSPC